MKRDTENLEKAVKNKVKYIAVDEDGRIIGFGYRKPPMERKTCDPSSELCNATICTVAQYINATKYIEE